METLADAQEYLDSCGICSDALTINEFLDMQGELFEILEDDKCLPEEQVQAIAKQLVLSLLRILVPSQLFIIFGCLVFPVVGYTFSLIVHNKYSKLSLLLNVTGESVALFAFQPYHSS